MSNGLHASPSPQATAGGEGWDEAMESWESVTSEKERWVRLIHHLETLTQLSNVIGQTSMRRLPPVLYAMYGVEGEGEEGGEAIDVCDLQVQLLSKGKPAAIVNLTSVAVVIATANEPRTAIANHCRSPLSLPPGSQMRKPGDESRSRLGSGLSFNTGSTLLSVNPHISCLVKAVVLGSWDCIVDY